MEKLFWLFKGPKMFLLKENVAGGPMGARLSRDVPERSKNVSKLARSILEIVGKIPFDPIKVVFGPPPGLDPKKYIAPNQKEIQKVKKILGPAFLETN
jgi:hypothetical protein